MDSVRAVCKNYPLDSFGKIQWILFELAPLRSHIPNFRPPVRQRRRSNSLPTPQTPEDFHPEMNPSSSICFDLNQASQSPTISMSPTSPTSISPYFRQAPQRSIHSLVRARLQFLSTTVRYACKVSIRLVFHSLQNRRPWTLSDGLLVAINDGMVADDDPWLVGGHGQLFLAADKQYKITLSSGLVGNGVYDTAAATFENLRLIRRRSSWSDVDILSVRPQAYVHVSDAKDPRIGFVLGPVDFHPSRLSGDEWIGTIPSCIQC